MCVQTEVPREDAVPGLQFNTSRRGPKCSVLSLRSFKSLCWRICSKPLLYHATQDMPMTVCMSFSSVVREAHSTVVESMMIQRKVGQRVAFIWAQRVIRPPGSLTVLI
jgi:hypothetical protein